ncbi:hypothetical protein CH375_05210, partial [Leptospira ellisii]
MTSSLRIDLLKRRKNKLDRYHDRISSLLSKLSITRLVFFTAFISWISAVYYLRLQGIYYLPSFAFLVLFFFFV